MRYTRNIGLKLREQGFKFQHDNNPDREWKLRYEVYQKGAINITIDHTQKKVFVDITRPLENVSCLSFAHLRILNVMTSNNQ